MNGGYNWSELRKKKVNGKIKGFSPDVALLNRDMTKHQNVRKG